MAIERNVHFYILSDSQAVIKSLKSNSFDSKSTWDCTKTIKPLEKANRVTIMWSPGQQGIMGNERANKLSRDKASAPWIGPEPTYGLTKTLVRQMVQEWEKMQKLVYWRYTLGLKQAKMLIIYSTQRMRQLINLSKIDNRAVTRILCPMRYYLDETAEHIMNNCVKLSHESFWE